MQWTLRMRVHHNTTILTLLTSVSPAVGAHPPTVTLRTSVFSKATPISLVWCLTSTVYHLLSDRLRESPGLLPLTMLKRNPFGRVLPHKRTLLRFPDARSEKRKIQAQKDREATIPTQNPSTYTIVSFQFTTNSIFPVQP